MVARPTAGVEDVLRPARRHRACLQWRHDRRGNEVEMTGFEKRSAMPKLLEAVAPARRAPPVPWQHVDVAVAGEIKGVPVRTGERARPRIEAEPADWTAQQPMSRTGQKRRHGAAPPG